MNFKDKVLSLLTSIRFYIITFAWVADYLDKISQAGFDLPTLFNQLSLWLGTVAGVGTLDKIVQAFKKNDNIS